VINRKHNRRKQYCRKRVDMRGINYKFEERKTIGLKKLPDRIEVPTVKYEELAADLFV
jgi:hypothetical protein